MTGLRLLLVEDSPADAKLVTRELARGLGDIHVERVDRAEALRDALTSATWDAVVCDWSLPSFDAPHALAMVHELGLDVPFVIVSGTVGEETAVEAMRKGAHDYVLKDKLYRLAPALDREIREARARAAHREAERALRESEAALRARERELRQAQKMEAVGRFAGGVAHDFNNVLSVILSYADLLLSTLPPVDPVRDDIQEIRNAAKRAADLTRQLLTFSRQQVLEPEIVDVDEALVEMEKMLRRLLGPSVELVLNRRSKSTVEADPGGIVQIVMNLVVNARDAMPSGGRVEVATDDFEVDRAFAAKHPGLRAGPHVRIVISDSGVGMAPDVQARIFEPFFTTKEIGRGTGLGLATVLGVVRQGGGAIWVESSPNAGAKFSVLLPCAGSEPTRRSTDAPGPLPRGCERVLLVDAEPAVRASTKNILVRLGYDVLAAKDADEALALSTDAAARIDLLLADVTLPRSTGPELAEKIAAVHPSMRVVCMSGYLDDAALVERMSRGEIPFLQKPITPESLARKVREALDATGSGGPS